MCSVAPIKEVATEEIPAKRPPWVLQRGQAPQSLAPYLDIDTPENPNGPGTEAACQATWTPSYSLDGEGAVVTGSATFGSYGSLYYADVPTLKAALVQKGPLVVFMCADSSLSGLFGDEVYDADFLGDGKNPTNHAVLLVGWNDTKNAWLIKNSWSTGWGDLGFGYIKYNTNELGIFGAIWVHADTQPTDTMFPNYAAALAAHNAALAKSLEVKCTTITAAKQNLQQQLQQIYKLGPGGGPDPIGPVQPPANNPQAPH